MHYLYEITVCINKFGYVNFIENIFWDLDMMHNTFMDMNMVHNTFVNVDMIHNTFRILRCITEEMGVRNVPNVQGMSVIQRMINVIGDNSVHGSVRTSKLQATTWTRPINYGLGTDI